MNNQIQFIVISVEDYRKQIIKKQFDDLNLSTIFDIHYIEGITPNNSTFSLKPVYAALPENAETLCCFLSHVKAMKWYVQNSPYPYLLLLEDDAAIKKNNFVDNLLKLIKHFEKKEFDYISLGYLPHTISEDLLKNPLIKNDNNVYWNLYKKYLHVTWGTQAQLFPRKTVESYLSIYDKLSIQEIYESICSYLNTHEFYYVNPPRLQIDCLNGLLKHQAIVFPPLIIELNNIKSLLNNYYHKNIYLDGAIRNLYKLSDYYSYDERNDNLKLSMQFPHYKNNIFENTFELVCRFGSDSCEKFKSYLIKKFKSQFKKNH